MKKNETNSVSYCLFICIIGVVKYHFTLNTKANNVFPKCRTLSHT
uniref:Uncharacterized protein n=1 Tax=Stegastes partitus TaxID=144197 RepID=A0A3B5B8C5_9TELE